MAEVILAFIGYCAFMLWLHLMVSGRLNYIDTESPWNKLKWRVRDWFTRGLARVESLCGHQRSGD